MHNLRDAGNVADGGFFDPATRAELPVRSVRSGLLQLVSQGGQLVLLVASGMALARLLTPVDYGLLAMAGAVTGFIESIRHFGIPQAAVHRHALTHEQASTLFWRTLQLSCIAALLMAAAAPLLAAFFGEPRVIAITLFLALVVAIRGTTALHEAVLMRRLRFGVIVAAELGALFISLTIGIVLALRGAGYWAVVVQSLLLAAIHALVLWSAVRWRPLPARRADRTDPVVRSLLAYGSDVTLFQMLTYAGRNTDRVLVGFFSGAFALGFYDAAYRWSLYPVQQIYLPLTSVAMAGLTRVRDDAEAYRAACRLSLLPVFSVVVPALALFALESERSILLLLGSQWGPAIPLFRVLCIGGIASAAIKITRWLFLAEGQTARQLRWGFLFLPVMVVATAAGAPWGPIGIAWGYTIGSWILVPSAVATCLRDSAFTPRDFHAAAARPLAAAAVATLAAWAAGQAWPAAIEGLAGALAFARQTLLFTLTYALVWIALPGGRGRVRDVLHLLRHASSRPTPPPPIPE